ncbi:MAG: hypothetical protein IJ151_01295 [Bacteroidales bacterium]|nr:hypothetical protein [Bacteroidales bacterium]
MKIEEAIVYVLASSGYGMKTEQIAREINDRGLFTRWDKKPVVGKYPVITLCGSTRFKEQFLEAQKRLTLGGYIGSSTRSEIEYAKKNGKEVRYLEE